MERTKATSEIAAFRKWSVEYVSALGRLGDESFAGILSDAEKVLLAIPDRPEKLDAAVFRAVVGLSDLLDYYPPEPPRDKYDAYFIGYGSVMGVSEVMENLVLVKGWPWPGEAYKVPLGGHLAVVSRNGKEVGRYKIKEAHSKACPVGEGEREQTCLHFVIELLPGDGGELEIGKGDAVVFVKRIPQPNYVRRMKRLTEHYGGMAWFPDVEEPWQGANSHALLQKLQEAPAKGGATREQGPAFLVMALISGAAFGAAIAWLLMRRKRRAS